MKPEDAVDNKQKFLDDLKTGVRHVVINDCYGGFGLSKKAQTDYCRLAGIDEKDFYERDISRDDPYLIKIVKELGSSAAGAHANLKIVEIPGDVEWIVQDYDGAEWIAEKHRTWS
jgi:hypothetical protein